MDMIWLWLWIYRQQIGGLFQSIFRFLIGYKKLLIHIIISVLQFLIDMSVIVLLQTFLIVRFYACFCRVSKKKYFFPFHFRSASCWFMNVTWSTNAKLAWTSSEVWQTSFRTNVLSVEYVCETGDICPVPMETLRPTIRHPLAPS